MKLGFLVPKQQTPEEKYAYMTQTPVQSLVLQLAVPTIITMLISSIYNITDTYFVSSLGTGATAAVSVISSVMTIIQAIAFFFGHGSGNYMSRAMGRRDMESAKNMASTAFFTAIGFGAILSIVGICILKPLVVFLGATEEIVTNASHYALFILLAAPFTIGSFVLNNQLRFQGSAVYGMVGMVSGALLNVILDPLFIFVFKTGVMGAAIATACSQVTSFVILLIGTSRGSNVRISFRAFKPSLRRYLELFRGGVPSLARQGIATVATIVLYRAARGIGAEGTAAIAALGIVTKVMQFAGSAVIGFGQGFQPVCGFNYGAGFHDRVRKAFYFCVIFCFIVLLVLSSMGVIFAEQVVDFFNSDPDSGPRVIEIGAFALRAQAIFFPLFSLVTITNMMLQTMGKAVPATITALSRQGLFFIPAVFILSHFFGLLGLQLSQPVSDVLSFCITLPMAIVTLRKLGKEGDNPDKAHDKK